MIGTLRAIGTPLAILAVTAAGLGVGLLTEGYWHFILALVALTTITGVGLNILLGLTGQISLGHVGFYAIGAYTAAILTLNGVSFWLAFPIAGADRGRGRRVAGAAGACASPDPISRWSPSPSPSSSSTAPSNGAT